MLIVISSPENLKNEIDTANQLFDLGLPCLHLRKPSLDREQLRRWIQGISSEHHPKLMLHQCHELALEFDLKGIHMKEILRDRLADIPSYLRDFREGHKQVSTGFHDLDACASEGQKYDYVFLSPIFDSFSKSGYHGKAWDVNALPQKPIALGGICEDNLSQVKKLGYAGVAVLGSIWHSPTPAQSFQTLFASYHEVYG